MIYKRDKLWHMDVTIHGVRYREALETTDRREALRLEKKRIGEIQSGRAASKSGREFARKPFGDAAKLFSEDRKGHVSERTIQFERERLKPLSAFFGETPLLRIKAEDITAYQRTRLAAGLSGKTINMDVGVLRLMMKRAKCWRIVADDIKLFPKRSHVVGRVLTPEQKAQLFQTAGIKPEWLVAHCAAVLAVSTTCRGVELKHLRWSAVDLFSRVLNVKRSKTEAGHRGIPLNNDAMAALARLWERGTAEQWIKEGKQAVKMTRLSCHRFRSNEVRLWLSLIAYNLGNLWRRLVLPKRIENWSLTSLQQRLVKTGGRLIKHARYYWLMLAESHLTRRLFGSMVRRMAALPLPTG